MLDFLVRQYAAIQNNNPFLSKIKFYGLQRYLLKSFANSLLPFYFQKTASKRTFKQKLTASDLIVSLTTFPARIGKVSLVIECMMRQSHPPDRIILWLSQKQFESAEKLPKQLLELKKHGLEIELVQEDIRSHKKYYYAVKRFPKANIITIDDDFFYPTTLIEQLIKEHKKHPKSVCCHRAHKIKIEEGVIQPYRTWEYEFKEKSNNATNFFTSGGGTLFPPQSLHPETTNKSVFMEKCRLADDIWLNAMVLLQETEVRKIESKYAVNLPIQYKNTVSLADENVNNNQNDIQLNAVRAHYKKEINKDIFTPIKTKQLPS